MQNNEAKQISLRAAIRERAERLNVAQLSACYSATAVSSLRVDVLKSQIRDLETELHALIQEMPL